MTTVALGYHLASSVRRRARDVAILRTLGADSRQLRATVHWQACFVAAVGLIVGIPLGIGIGTRVHTSIANSLGVVPAVATPGLVILSVVAGVLAVANLSAIAPSRRATRTPVATVLRGATSGGQ
jgi:putative ABC transport system permease protein